MINNLTLLTVEDVLKRHDVANMPSQDKLTNLSDQRLGELAYNLQAVVEKDSPLLLLDFGVQYPNSLSLPNLQKIKVPIKDALIEEEFFSEREQNIAMFEYIKSREAEYSAISREEYNELVDEWKFKSENYHEYLETRLHIPFIYGQDTIAIVLYNSFLSKALIDSKIESWEQLNDFDMELICNTDTIFSFVGFVRK